MNYGESMISLDDSELRTIKKILGRLYLENGITEEVILLSRIVDKVILDKYFKSKVDNVENK